MQFLRDIPDDQMERMRNQANRIGTANLSRAADIAAEGSNSDARCDSTTFNAGTDLRTRILLPIGDSGESGMLSRIERLERAENNCTDDNTSTTSKGNPCT